ncbi:MAG: MarR family winged helix-turn-helix transcriptional regulator [Myxococcota bacterium]
MSRERKAMTCIGFRLRKSSRAVTAFYDRRYRATGVRVTQWPILSALRAAGSLSLGRLADAVGMDASTVSRNIQPLVRDGYIQIEDRHEDRRRQRVASLTPHGHEKWDEVYVVWERAQEELLDVLDDAWSRVSETLDMLDAKVRDEGDDEGRNQAPKTDALSEAPSPGPSRDRPAPKRSE